MATKGIPIHTIYTHNNPHLDEIGGIALLKRYGGEEHFPGIENAQIKYWKNGSGTPDGKSPERLEQEGILLTGFGGGWCDEHAGTSGSHKHGKCTMLLIAERLEIADDAILQPLLNYVLSVDAEPVDSLFQMATTIKNLYPYLKDTGEVVGRGIEMVEAHLDEQERLHVAAPEDFDAATKEMIPGPGGKMLMLVHGSPKYTQFARYARRKGADIVVQQTASGNVQIFGDHRVREWLPSGRFKNIGWGRTDLYFDDIIRMLRVEEQDRAGKRETFLFRDLSLPGNAPGAEKWHYHHGRRMILNGSLTATDVPPTLIPFTIVIEIVKAGVNPATFHAERAAQCAQGICTSNPKKPCSWYDFGLPRCAALRRSAYQQRQGQANAQAS